MAAVIDNGGEESRVLELFDQYKGMVPLKSMVSITKQQGLSNLRWW